jgi:hypothetical protein
MPFQLTPLDMAEPAPASEALARIAVSLSMLSWLGVVFALFWR